ncbi:MAG: hypothetical protein AB7I50_21285 [Vicinamibacterales bacterium]
MRWKSQRRCGPTSSEVAAAIPDAVAVRDEAGELVGWDETAAHAYLAELGLPSPCDDDCVGRGHVDAW